MSTLTLSFPGFNGTSITIAPSNTVACDSTGCLHTITSGLITLFFIIAILLSLAYLLWGGIDWIMSSGDKTKLQKSHMKIVYAIIGLIVVFMAFAILNFVGSVLGLPLTNGI